MEKSFNRFVQQRQGPIGITVDMVIFTVQKSKLQVLLIERARSPFKAHWAIPGGFLRSGETLEKAARRELREESGVFGDFYLEQLYTFSEPKRDPRGRILSTAYVALLNSDKILLKAGSDARAAEWFLIEKLPKSLAFDHGKVLSYALQRLRWKVEYTNVAWSLLPTAFTLSDLQKAYEAILGKRLDKRNFRKKILQLNIIAPTSRHITGRHRPAQLYRFKTRRFQILASAS